MALRRTLQPYFGKACSHMLQEANRVSKLVNAPGLSFDQREKLMEGVTTVYEKLGAMLVKRRIRSLTLQAKRYSR